MPTQAARRKDVIGGSLRAMTSVASSRAQTAQESAEKCCESAGKALETSAVAAILSPVLESVHQPEA
jgi:hypothetical protein